MDAPRDERWYGRQLLGMSFISNARRSASSPANRGSMLTVTLLLFVLMGSVAGYSAAITYKAFKGISGRPDL